MRLIDADNIFEDGLVKVYQDDAYKTASEIVENIRNAPTVEAVPECKNCTELLSQINDSINVIEEQIEHHKTIGMHNAVIFNEGRLIELLKVKQYLETGKKVE